MKPIFNSLGSDYRFSFVLCALGQLIRTDRSAPRKLTGELEKMFEGKACLFYKGRDAIEFVLRSYGIGESSEVLTQGFACYAIEEAIVRAGAKPVFVDVEKNNLNLNLETLNGAYKDTKNARAVIIQYTLGSPIQVSLIKEWCKKNKLLLIEDLAQSLGATDEKGNLLGSYGDAVVVSFGRGKVVDAVSGGVAILRKEGAREVKTSGAVKKSVIRKDMVYPLVAWKVRKTYNFLLGPLILRIFRRLGLVTSATWSPTNKAISMPKQHAALVLFQLEDLKSSLTHRRKIAEVYYREIQNKNSFITTKNDIEHGSNLRFAFRAENPEKLLVFIRRKNVHITDRWYRAAVDCGTLSVTSSYREGTTPNAEELAAHVVNLPTHREVRVKDAMRIVGAVNEYFQQSNGKF